MTCILSGGLAIAYSHNQRRGMRTLALPGRKQKGVALLCAENRPPFLLFLGCPVCRSHRSSNACVPRCQTYFFVLRDPRKYKRWECKREVVVSTVYVQPPPTVWPAPLLESRADVPTVSTRDVQALLLRFCFVLFVLC